jgi:hypothetical protein
MNASGRSRMIAANALSKSLTLPTSAEINPRPTPEPQSVILPGM